MKLSKKQLASTIYALNFTLLSDRGNMTRQFIMDCEEAIDLLVKELEKI